MQSKVQPNLNFNNQLIFTFMMNQVIELQIDATLPSFITNFDEVKSSVQERLKAYDIAVNLENLPEAKKLATELNFFAKKINEKRIEKQKEASAPMKS